MSSPSTGGKLPKNGQDVRFSDVAPGMACRNGGNFPKRTGNTNELGRLSFAYFSFGGAKKSKAYGRHGWMDGWQYLRKTIQLRGYFDFGDCKQIVMLGFVPHHQPTHRPEINFAGYWCKVNAPSPLLQ